MKTILFSIIISLIICISFGAIQSKPNVKRLEAIEYQLDIIANAVVNINYQLDVIVESMRE
jgi:hypothetical protein